VARPARRPAAASGGRRARPAPRWGVLLPAAARLSWA